MTRHYINIETLFVEETEDSNDAEAVAQLRDRLESGDVDWSTVDFSVVDHEDTEGGK